MVSIVLISLDRDAVSSEKGRQLFAEKTVLAQVAKKIAEQKLEARVVGVEVLEGQTTGYDYVALSFEANNEFAACSREISEELATRSFIFSRVNTLAA